MAKIENARAKRDVRERIASGRISNFLEGHTYRCCFRKGNVLMSDEDRNAYMTDEADFFKNFELAS